MPPLRSTMQLVAPRGLSTRPMPSSRSSPPRSAEAGRDRAVEQPVQQLERLRQLQRPLLQTGLDVAPRPAPPDGGLEAVVGEPGEVARASSASPAARAAGPACAEAIGVGRGRETPISGSRSSNDELNWSSRQPRSASSCSVSSSACFTARTSLEAELAAPRHGRCRRGNGDP